MNIEHYLHVRTPTFQDDFSKGVDPKVWNVYSLGDDAAEHWSVDADGVSLHLANGTGAEIALRQTFGFGFFEFVWTPAARGLSSVCGHFDSAPTAPIAFDVDGDEPGALHLSNGVDASTKRFLPLTNDRHIDGVLWLPDGVSFFHDGLFCGTFTEHVPTERLRLMVNLFTDRKEAATLRLKSVRFYAH